MKKIERIILEQKDLELLTKEMPQKPCKIKFCSNLSSCCGCPDLEEYFQEEIKEYKDRHIFELASEIQQMRDKQRKIKNLKEEIEEIRLSIEQLTDKNIQKFLAF